MKKVILLVLIVLISSVSFAQELKPGRLWINGVEIPYEKGDFEDLFSDLEKSFEKKSISYVYANGQRIAKVENNEVYYFHNDHLGSPVAITNSSGNVIWQADYKPFGESFNEISFDSGSSVKYNSKELDKDTELHYYGARYYNAPAGRFITADTVKGELVDPQSLNLYVYTLNNPMKYIDPTGNQGVRLNPDEPASGYNLFSIEGLKQSYGHVKKLFTGDIKGFREDYEGYNPEVDLTGFTSAVNIGKIIPKLKTADILKYLSRDIPITRQGQALEEVAIGAKKAAEKEFREIIKKKASTWEKFYGKEGVRELTQERQEELLKTYKSIDNALKEGKEVISKEYKQSIKRESKGLEIDMNEWNELARGAGLIK